MIQECIETLFDRYAEAIRHGLTEAVSAQAPEAFHRLRVGIKKTRSLLTLVEALNPTFDAAKQYGRLRPLFKAAADVRDFQVQRELAGKIAGVETEDLTTYLQFLGSRAEKGAARFGRAARSFDPRTLDRIRRSILDALMPLDEDTAAMLATARVRALLREVSSWPAGEDGADPHDLRTLTKRTFYTWEAIESCLPGTLADDRTRNCLQDLQQLLGRWHDMHVAGNFLGRYREKRGVISDDLEGLQATLRREEERLLRKSVEQWRRLAGS